MSSLPLLRILVVDDHAETRCVMSRILTLRNYAVVEAASIAQALAIFRNDVFDLVISDLGLPEGSGHDLIERLLEVKPVKAIALTPHGTRWDAANGKLVGFVKHLTKPVDLDQWTLRLSKWPACRGGGNVSFAHLPPAR